MKKAPPVNKIKFFLAVLCFCLLQAIAAQTGHPAAPAKTPAHTGSNEADASTTIGKHRAYWPWVVGGALVIIFASSLARRSRNTADNTTGPGEV